MIVETKPEVEEKIAEQSKLDTQEGEIESEEECDWGMHEISIFGYLAYPIIPIEKHFETEELTYGGNIEYTRSNLWLGLGFGSSRMKDALNSDSTIYSTNLLHFYAKVSITRLVEQYFEFSLDPNLDVYTNIGVTNWKSKFQKVKYNTVKEDYHVEMDQKGWGYLLGLGIRYHFYNIIIGAQYQLYNSSKTEFSKTVTYTTFEGVEYSITDSYHVYPGFQQVQFLLGYRIQL